MRLRSLELLAYGPFTGTVLDLSGGTPGGLHVVFGPNEAGKSTALRAITALLYGMERSPRDAHRHPMQELRVGACLEARDGRRLDVVRRKKDKDSLRGRDDEPRDETELARLLGGVGRELFLTLFGLDHQRLAEGGEALLQGRGDIGESLFDAGAGGPSIHHVLAALKSEADALFKPNARNPDLNRAITQYREAQKQSRDAPLRSQVYLDQQQALEQQQAARATLSAQRQALLAEQARLERARRVMPLFARRRQHREQREQLGEVPVLHERSAERRQAAEQIASEQRRDAVRLRADMDELASRITQLGVTQADVRLAALDGGEVETLREDLGAHSKAQRDLVKREAAARTHENDVMSILRGLGRAADVAQADQLRISAAAQARVRELSQRHAALGAELQAARREHAAAEHDLEAERARLSALAEPPDTAALEAALADATRGADAQEALAEFVAERAKLETRLARELRTIGLFGGSAEELSRLPVPSDEEVDALERRLEASQRAIAALAADQKRLLERRSELAARVDAMRRAGDVPTEAQLTDTRKERDACWQLVRSAWRQGRGVPKATDGDLDTAFERSVALADEVSDRLRREADRVVQLAQLQADLAGVERDLERLERECVAADGQAAAARGAWHSAWQRAGVEPLDPRSMRAWLRRRTEICQLVERAEALALDAARLESRKNALWTMLSSALAARAADDIPLRALEQRAHRELGEAQRLAAARRTSLDAVRRLERAVAETRRRVEASEQALAAWSSQWSEAVAPLGLRQDASPTEASAMLDELGRLFLALEAAHRERRSAHGIVADATRFAERVAELTERYCPELCGLEPVEAARELVRRHRDACERVAERARLEQALAAVATQLAHAERSVLDAEQELAELVKNAGVRDAAELARVEQRLLEASELDRELSAVEHDLIEVGDGLSIDELAKEAAGVERDSLPARQADLRSELEQINEQLENLARSIQSIEGGLERFETGSTAADAAQDLALRAASIRELSERWMRARMASVILEREIQRYRESNQAPILKRAAELFPRLTLGAYKGLRVGREQPILLCVRSDGSEVDVHGALSDGTLRQLYLALRLASLERWLERNEALPFILDDVLVHFDEERSAAALEILGELAARVQILFFSHQKSLVDLARRVVPEERLFVHELSGPKLQPDAMHAVHPSMT